MHLVMIGGSDAGISAALRARELDPSADVTVVVADAYPNFSICGIPYYVSGEVTHWRNLAHRTVADLEAGMALRLDTTARRIDVAGRKLLLTGPGGRDELISYDKLVVGTGAVPVRPPIVGLGGPGALGPDDGVHVLHTMGDTFAVMSNSGGNEDWELDDPAGKTLEEIRPIRDEIRDRVANLLEKLADM
jgi:NADPH-dependent 2,4-dienoyl-CoA reductase/sulfur reductase-like enzyme